MELTEIISELENCTEEFPRQAVETAIQKKEEITPLLLANLAEWKDKLEELNELPDYFLHIYALHLLAQFKETKAYPLIIEFFSTPGEITMDVTGDVVTESLHRILASVSGGDIEPIKKLIENPQANQFVRGAGLDSLLVLVAQKVISRELVIDYFEELFNKGLKQESEEEPYLLWADLVVYSAKLYPQELKPYIDNAFASDKIDQFMVSQEDIDYYLQLGKEETLKRLEQDSFYSFIEDTISEMEWWAYIPSTQPKTIAPPPPRFEDKSFSPSKNTNSSKKKKKKNMQKQSRKKNRSKKKK